MAAVKEHAYEICEKAAECIWVISQGVHSEAVAGGIIESKDYIH